MSTDAAAAQSPSGDAYRISTAQQRGATVVAIDGEMDYDGIPSIRTAIAAALLGLDGRVLILDLTNVTFLGSVGLSALVDAAHAAVDARAPLRVVVDHARAVIRPIQISGVDGFLQLYDSVDAALPA